MEGFTEGWFVETINGTTYRMLSAARGHPVGLANALHHGPWYVKKTTGFNGTEEELFNSITEKDRATLEFSLYEEGLVKCLKVYDSEKRLLFNLSDCRLFHNVVYQI